MNERVNVEIVAEVFRIVRANADRPKREILKLIHEHLPEETKEDIAAALKELMDAK